ncbi:MAG: DUF1573 domain-containing protein [Planctomycetota bacterium]
MFPKREHDFRIVSRGATSEYHFEFTNLFEEDVHISGVRTSCGCTTPTVTRDLLQTHQAAAVVAEFNTKSFVGQKAATITVIFDRPAYAEVQLKVKGFIRTDIAFEPTEVDFGELGAGESAARDVEISHSGNSNWEILDVRSHCEGLSVSLDPAERKPGMVKYRMRVELSGEMPEGDIRERLTLISNDRRFPTTEMAVNGRVRPVVSVSPKSVSLGRITPMSQANKRLVVRGEEPFEVKEVLSADSRLSFETPEGSKKVHFLKMKFNGDGSSKPLSQEVRVVTSLPGDKSASCIVTGTMR